MSRVNKLPCRRPGADVYFHGVSWHPPCCGKGTGGYNRSGVLEAVLWQELISPDDTFQLADGLASMTVVCALALTVRNYSSTVLRAKLASPNNGPLRKSHRLIGRGSPNQLSSGKKSAIWQRIPRTSRSMPL